MMHASIIPPGTKAIRLVGGNNATILGRTRFPLVSTPRGGPVALCYKSDLLRSPHVSGTYIAVDLADGS